MQSDNETEINTDISSTESTAELEVNVLDTQETPTKVETIAEEPVLVVTEVLSVDSKAKTAIQTPPKSTDKPEKQLQKEVAESPKTKPTEKTASSENTDTTSAQQAKREAEKQKDALSNEILLSALKLFTEKGYFNTSLTDIAQLSGVKNSAGIYKHFKNKQEIARALYFLILDRLSVSIDDIRRRNRKSPEQLREIVDLWFKLTDEAPEIMKFILMMNVSEFLPDEKIITETAPFIKILRILHRGIRAGEIKAVDSQRAYCYFFGVIENTLKQVLLGSLSQKADFYQNDTWNIAWATIVKR